MDDATIAAPMALDLSKANGELYAALAKAQARVGTVGKDGRNRDAGYNYATADSMIRGGRAARDGTGLALLTTWSAVEIPAPAVVGKDKGGPGQWPCALVTLHFALVHKAGGALTGTLVVHAIGSTRRPPDKAIAAAATYGEGFVERNLMRLDRAEEGADDVDRREEVDTHHRVQVDPAKVAADYESILAELGMGDAQQVAAAKALASEMRDAGVLSRGQIVAIKAALDMAHARLSGNGSSAATTGGTR